MPRRNPFEEIERMFEEMNEGLRAFDTGLTQGVPIDVVETDDSFVVTADLPGYEKSDIDVRLSGSTLVVSAERSAEEEEEAEEGSYVRRERTRESVTRSVRLSERVDPSSTNASYNNGVLTVTLAKESTDSGESIPIE
ncbi:Hsp20/alpha crystallin family protein [Halomarina halobia]|uniref:Hsp20/alpha crystallin family protein n=1 Tax=Halomarina halobia TaxID=3033386 RepID=A0ABD6AAP8_9EURY|nr:Hsp20/alpha crystallin family protein [Halomarina sp. PSR21]